MIDHPSTFAHQFARLVALLARRPDAVEAQKGSLRAAVLLARERPIALVRGADQLAVNREPLSTAIPDVGELAARLDAHAVTLLRVEAGATAAALLAAARQLAAAPVEGAAAGDAAVVGRMVVAGAEPAPTADPPGAPSGIAARAASRRPAAGSGPPVEPSPEPTAEQLAPEQPGPEQPGPEQPAAEPAAGGAAAQDGRQPLAPDAGGAAPAGEAAVATLLARLREARSAGAAAALMEELTGRAALAARAGDGEAVVALLSDAIERVPPELDRAEPTLAAALARLTGAEQLDAVCDAAVRRRADRDRCDAVLAHAPEAGAVLARRLAGAETSADRAAYRDTLVRLRAGAAPLAALLDHPSAAVAVCAAEALVAVGGAGSHTALMRALDHANASVRRAAVHALGALGASRAAPALRGALRDGSRAVRAEAAGALVLLGGSGVGTALGDALADETHPEAQLELLAALGRLATADAVQCLVQAAAPAGRLFGRKPVPFRCAAVAALGVARTPAALAALRELANDRERAVREAVFLAALRASGAAAPRVGES